MQLFSAGAILFSKEKWFFWPGKHEKKALKSLDWEVYLVVLVTILGADLDNLIGSLCPCSDIAGEEWCSGAIENLCWLFTSWWKKQMGQLSYYMISWV